MGFSHMTDNFAPSIGKEIQFSITSYFRFFLSEGAGSGISGVGIYWFAR